MNKVAYCDYLVKLHPSKFPFLTYSVASCFSLIPAYTSYWYCHLKTELSGGAYSVNSCSL